MLWSVFYRIWKRIVIWRVVMVISLLVEIFQILKLEDESEGEWGWWRGRKPRMVLFWEERYSPSRHKP